MRLRERSMTRRGFLPGLMMTCNGCTQQAPVSIGSSTLTAPKAMYSSSLSRTTPAFICTAGVFSYSTGGGAESRSRVTPDVIHAAICRSRDVSALGSAAISASVPCHSR